MFQSTARDFIEKAIEADRTFLAAFDPQRDKDAFEREWNARKSGARSEVNAFEPNYEGSLDRVGRPGSRCSALGSHAFAARAGHHLAPQPLSSGRNVFEELGDGFTLLSLDGDDTICRAFETAAEQMRIPADGHRRQPPRWPRALRGRLRPRPPRPIRRLGRDLPPRPQPNPAQVHRPYAAPGASACLSTRA